jgi:hypothetical protein
MQRKSWPFVRQQTALLKNVRASSLMDVPVSVSADYTPAASADITERRKQERGAFLLGT